MWLVRDPLEAVPGIGEMIGEVMQHDTHVEIPYNPFIAPLNLVHPVLSVFHLRPATPGTMPGKQSPGRKPIEKCVPATRRVGTRFLVVSDPVGLFVRLVNVAKGLAVLAM